jgi:hypothetical protein
MATEQINQELEEAAKEWVDSFYQKEKEYSKVGRNKCNPQSGFIAGAEWQKEQSITDTIEFTQWLTKYVILRSQDLWWYKGKDYSSIEMFNIWKNKQ